MTPTQNHAPARWLRQFHLAPPGAPRLVCLPHAGGAASYYAPFARALAGAVGVEAVQYPGRQDRFAEPAVTDLHVLADRITQVLHTEQLGAPAERPLALFGHSMGAWLAFEVAARLESLGVVPTHVFVSGAVAPSRREVEERAWPRTDADLVEELKQLAGTASELLADAELLQLLLPSIRADFQAVEGYRYRPGPALRTPVTAVTGDSDTRAGVTDVAAWAEHTASAFDLQVLPGGHFYLTGQLPEVAELVRRRLLPAAPRVHGAPFGA